MYMRGVKSMKNKNMPYIIVVVSIVLTTIFSLIISYNDVLLTTYKGVREDGLVKMGMEQSDWSNIYSLYESSQTNHNILFVVICLLIVASIIYLFKNNKNLIKYFIIINLITILITYFSSNIFFQNSKLKQFVNEHKFYEAIILSKSMNNGKETDTYKKSINYFIDKDKPTKALEIFEYLEKDLSDKNILESIKYELAKALITKNEYWEAENLLETIIDYKDSKDVLIEAKYNYAIKLYNEKTYLSDAKKMFEELEDYKDSKQYYEKSAKELAEKIAQEEEKERIENLNKVPAIGMTKEQVRASAWGSPERVNKTTTIYGTREQWVYSLTRYVYFNEDGIVYSIQQ